jgi:GT2 family glycosyltransferase
VNRRLLTSPALEAAISATIRAAIGAAIAVLAGRRAVTLAAALLPRRDPEANLDPAPSVTVVVPVFNEAARLPELLSALEGLDYPRDRLSVVLVDDGSADGSDGLIRAWAEDRRGASAVHLRSRSGKATALNAVKALPPGELTVVCDADLRPRPTLLRELVRPFADPRVGAVSAYLAPANHDRGVVAGYASLESWVDQLVTSAGKDRLSLDPPAHGCAAYRTAALESVGWFSGSGPGEDVRASVALSRRGWRTRFAPAAIADNLVVSTWGAYWHQHVRWARNLLSARRVSAPLRGNDHQPAWWRLGRSGERLLASAGYSDRLVLAGAVALAVPRLIPRWLAAVYPGVIAAELIAAVLKTGRGRQLPRYLMIAAAGVTVDLLASAAAVWAHLRRRAHRWPGDSAHRPQPINRSGDGPEVRPRRRPSRPPSRRGP